MKPPSLMDKLTEWGIDPEQARVEQEYGSSVCGCNEPTEDGPCPGSWREVEEAAPASTKRTRLIAVICDACGFETVIPEADTSKTTEARLARARLPAKFVGQKFEEDDQNKSALYIVRSWLDDFKSEKAAGRPVQSGLGLWGAAGVGKTHLLVGLCTRLIRDCQAIVMFRSVRELLLELQRFDNEVVRSQTWEKARTVEILALDDFGAERLTDWRAEQLAELVDARYLAEQPLLLTTNFDPKSWGDIVDERTRHRLLDRGLVMPVHVKGRDRNQARLEDETWS